MMRSKIYYILIPLIIVFAAACKKKPIVEQDNSFIGGWRHNIDESETIYLIINENSKGFIEHYENDQFEDDTQHRKWLIKNNVLYFGWLGMGSEKFTIDQYPIIATSPILNNLDTVNIGDTYMILEGDYYVH